MARVVGGDFKKNSTIKLSRHKGEVVFLELSTVFMKSEFYYLNKALSVTSEGQVGNNTLLKIDFSDGKWVLLSAGAKDAEDIISAGIKPNRHELGAERDNIVALVDGNNSVKKSSKKKVFSSIALAVFILILLVVLFPVILRMLSEQLGIIPVIIAAFIFLLYVYCLRNPLNIPFGNTRWQTIILLCIIGFSILTALGTDYPETKLPANQIEPQESKTSQQQTTSQISKPPAPEPIKPVSAPAAKTANTEPSGDFWVTITRLNRRSCPSTNCGVVGQYFYREKPDIFERKNGWARVTKYYDASCINGISEYVDAGNKRCDANNGIVNGQFAEWVSGKFLSNVRPPDPSAGATGMEALVAGSDDYREYHAIFAQSAKSLISSGRCTAADFKENAGWAKSFTHRNQPIYFTYCGAAIISNRLYLNAETGKVFR